jgi:uncharacterized protein
MTTLIDIAALKYDQQVHLQFTAEIVDDDGDQVRIRYPLGTRIQHHTRGLLFREETNTEVWLWRSRWYNVFVNLYPDGSAKSFYCNVAQPVVLDSVRLYWIDLDLDVKVRPDGSYDILDEDEFEVHRLKYGYPADVQIKARQAVTEILDLARSRQGPFALLTVDLL